MQDYMKEIQLIVFYEATAFGGGSSPSSSLSYPFTQVYLILRAFLDKLLQQR
ncbi:MAG: hypothetical protein M1470_07975 [Bacteroidetes bacterium]|nr:hypothetical protein [Bacteroidota bacterium]MCL5738509.1 hypothetical protein [Bacteroidota bacterium]